MRTFFEHPLMILLMTLVAGIFMVSLYISSKDGKSGAQIVQILEESVERQKKRVEALEQQAQLANDPFIQEKIQRDELLLQKPGEIVLQLPPITVPSPTPEPTPKQMTPWEEWKLVLF